MGKKRLEESSSCEGLVTYLLTAISLKTCSHGEGLRDSLHREGLRARGPSCLHEEGWSAACLKGGPYSKTMVTTIDREIFLHFFLSRSELFLEFSPNFTCVLIVYGVQPKACIESVPVKMVKQGLLCSHLECVSFYHDTHLCMLSFIARLCYVLLSTQEIGWASVLWKYSSYQDHLFFMFRGPEFL